MTIVVNPPWSSDPGELIEQAQALFLHRDPQGRRKLGVGPPNLATPRNMLPLIRAQLEWLREFARRQAVYAGVKSWADAVADVPFFLPLLSGVVVAQPGSVADEARRAVERFETYVRELELAGDGDCLGSCAYQVTEPWLVGWYPDREVRSIPDVATPALLARGWSKGAEVWKSTITDALTDLPLDMVEDVSELGGGALSGLDRVGRWVIGHPKTTLALAVGVVGAVVAAPYAAPLIAARVWR